MDTKTPTPETPPQIPEGVTVCNTFADFMQIASYGDNPRLIDAVRRFFASTNAADTGEDSRRDSGAITMNEKQFLQFLEGDAGDVPANVPAEDSATRPASRRRRQAAPPSSPVLIDETPRNIANYLTGLFKPLVSAQYVKAGAIAQNDGAARGLRTFASLNRQEMEVLNFVMIRARKNLQIQADRLRRGLPVLTQGGRVTYTEVLRAYGYGKNADVNDKLAAAFDALAREKFLFFNEVRGQLQALSILDFSIDLKKQVKTYEISPQFLNTLPAIDACLLYYNIDVLTGGVLTAADVLKYRGDKGILLVCVHLLFERPYYNGKPFKYSSVIERAAACGVNIKKSTNWKRAIKQAFNYLGFDVIDGDSDTARAMVTASGAEFTPDADKFIIRQIATQKDTENDTKK